MRVAQMVTWSFARPYSMARNTVMKALRCLAGGGLGEMMPGWETFGAR